MSLLGKPYASLFAAPRRKRDPFAAPPDPLGRDGSRQVAEEEEIAGLDAGPSLDAKLEAARRDWRDGVALDRLLGQPFALHGSVGRNKANRPGDVFKVQALLHREGYLDADATDGPTGFFGLTDDEPIRRFQRDHGLKPDGYLDPGGETIARIRDFYRPAGNLPSGNRLALDGPPLTPEQERQIPTNMLRQAENDVRPQPQQQVAQAPRQTAPSEAVPDYRREVFRRPENAGAWEGFGRAVQALAKIGTNEAAAYRQIFAAEGGMSVDGRSQASSGITPETAADLHKRGFLPGIDPGKAPKDYTTEERAQFMRGYFNDTMRSVGGAAALERIPDAAAAAALADTLYMHGRRPGAQFIQRAVNDVRRTLDQREIDSDSRFGPETYEAYRVLASDPGSRRALLDALIEARSAPGSSGSRSYGEIERIDQFREKAVADEAS